MRLKCKFSWLNSRDFRPTIFIISTRCTSYFSPLKLWSFREMFWWQYWGWLMQNKQYNIHEFHDDFISSINYLSRTGNLEENIFPPKYSSLIFYFLPCSSCFPSFFSVTLHPLPFLLPTCSLSFKWLGIGITSFVYRSEGPLIIRVYVPTYIVLHDVSPCLFPISRDIMAQWLI